MWGSEEFTGAINGGNGGKVYGFDPVANKYGWGVQNPNGAGEVTLPGSGTKTKSPADVVQDIIQNGTNAVPQSLKDLGKLTTNTMTSSAGVSAPVQQASDKAANYISDLVGQGNPDYTGQRVTPQNGQEKDSAAFIQQMLAGGGPGGNAMKGAATQKTDTSGVTNAAGPIDAQKLTDVDISKYMNPALTAQYDAILHGNAVMNNATRARQARSGAFGANSDVAQAQNNESTQRQLALAGSDAFKTAQGAAQGDVAAENANRQGNRTAGMSAASTALGANLTDAQRALMGGSMLNDDARATAGASAAAGATARGVDQAGLDAKWQEYLRKQGYGLQLASGASGALAGLPGGKTLTTEQLGPSEAGQEIGAYIGLNGIMNQYGTNSRGGGSVTLK